MSDTQTENQQPQDQPQDQTRDWPTDDAGQPVEAPVIPEYERLLADAHARANQDDIDDVTQDYDKARREVIQRNQQRAQQRAQDQRNQDRAEREAEANR